MKIYSLIWAKDKIWSQNIHVHNYTITKLFDKIFTLNGLKGSNKPYCKGNNEI